MKSDLGSAKQKLKKCSDALQAPSATAAAPAVGRHFSAARVVRGVERGASAGAATDLAKPLY